MPKIKLKDGWNLTDFGEIRDSKIPDMINAVSGAIEKVPSVMKGVGMPEYKFSVGLYKFIFDDKTGLVKGLQLIDLEMLPAWAYQTESR